MIYLFLKVFFFLLGLPFQNLPSKPSVALQYCPKGYVFADYFCLKDGLDIQINSLPNIRISLNSGLIKYNWTLNKQASDTIILDGFEETRNIPSQFSKNKNGISFKTALTKLGAITASNVSYNQDIIQFPDWPIEPFSSWFEYAIKSFRLSFTFYWVPRIDYFENYSNVYFDSFGFDYRHVRDIIIAKAFFTTRIVSSFDGLPISNDVFSISLLASGDSIFSNTLISLSRSKTNRKLEDRELNR